MSKTVLIFRRELTHTIRRAGYLVMTLIVPVLALIAIGVLRLALGAPAPARGSFSPEALAAAGIILPGIFSLLLALALILGSTALIRGLADEKESRLIEVLFSSVSIRQLLLGKVLGLGLAGLIQVAVWVISLPLLLELAANAFGGFIAQLVVPEGFVLYGIVYFILGYLLFAVFSIGLGAISANANEGSQLSMIYTMASFVPLWLTALIVNMPDSPIWVVFTIVPITAPVQVMMRLGLTGVPTWQILASIAAMLITITVGLSLAVRVFRLYMLAGGSRPKLAEIARGIRRGG